MKTISPEYATLNAELHRTFKDYGNKSQRHLPQILKLMRTCNCKTVLDYGCGKGGLVKALEKESIDVQGYDPAVAVYSSAPTPADLVVCTDVLEHIERPCLSSVLHEINQMTRQAAFLLIALRYDSTKTLPDGTNPHKIVEPLSWWLRRLRNTFIDMDLKVVEHRAAHHAVIHIIKNAN